MSKEKRIVRVEVHAPSHSLMAQLQTDFLVVRVENSIEFTVGSYLKKAEIEKLIESTDIVVVQTGVWGSRR